MGSLSSLFTLVPTKTKYSRSNVSSYQLSSKPKLGLILTFGFY
uniref:Uncharacterized protein n=1 Tax=Rhizophora mucronata TaxID=61149 RepID=A0A2P2PCK0_RHIMU